MTGVTATAKTKANRFAARGMLEATRLRVNTDAQGARETMGEELDVEKDYVAGADTAVGKMLRAGQAGGQLVGVMLTITIAAALGMIGTKVTSQIESSVTDRDLSNVNKENQTIYENSSESIGSGFADAMELTDIVFLVLFFTVIIGALLAFRSSR